MVAVVCGSSSGGCGGGHFGDVQIKCKDESPQLLTSGLWLRKNCAALPSG